MKKLTMFLDQDSVKPLGLKFLVAGQLLRM